jgi:UDP-D-galactose:(glucosyl)LPS alpha-1,6-D-galactosyltransferase
MERILIVTNSLAGGGAERSMNLVANGLSSRGYEVCLVPINAGPEDLVQVTTKVMPIDRPWKSGLKETFFALFLFRRILRQFRPDVLILNCELPELFGAIFSNGCKIIVVEHTSQPWKGRAGIGVIIRAILIEKSSHFVGVSENLRMWPARSSIKTVVRNPLPPDFLRLRDRSETINHQKKLVFIGRLNSVKRPDIFLQICEATKLPGLIIGEGAERGAIENWIGQRGLNIRLLGNVDNPWLNVNSQDLLIVSSDYEGDGLVVVEGLAHGIPMILRDNSDLRKFGFPDSNHFIDASDAIKIISREDSFASFLVPKDDADFILKPRGVAEVINEWERLISGLYNPMSLA